MNVIQRCTTRAEVLIGQRGMYQLFVPFAKISQKSRYTRKKLDKERMTQLIKSILMQLDDRRMVGLIDRKAKEDNVRILF